MKGALEFLNSNGYLIKRKDSYKETSAGTVPFQKFALQSRISENPSCCSGRRARLIDGNAVGVLVPATTGKGGRR